MDDDTQLLREYAAAGRESSFTELVHRHLPRVYAAALRRTDGNAALAQDVAQTVFNTLARDAARLSPRTILAGWLYVATRHAAANALRAERRRKHREEEAHMLHTLDQIPDQPSDADWTALRPVLDSAIDGLTAADRDAVLLRYFESKSWAEVGRALRLSENTARMRAERALDKIRTALAKRGITSTSAALAAAFVARASAALPTQFAPSVAANALTSAAAAAAATGGLTTFFTTMSLSKTTATAAALLALLALGTAWHERDALAELEQKLATTASDGDRLRAQLRRSEQDLAAARAKVELDAGERKRMAAEIDAKSKAAAAANKDGFASGATIHLRDVAREHPEFAEFRKETLRREIMRTYGADFAVLNLPPEQLGSLKELLIEKKLATADAEEAALNSGLEADSPAFNQAVNAAKQAVDDQIAGIVGTSGVAVLNNEYVGHWQADELNTVMQESGASLSPDQLNQVALWIGSVHQPPPGGGNVLSNTLDPATGLSPQDQAVLAKAAAQLPPAEFAALRQAALAQAQFQQLSQKVWALYPGTRNMIDD